MVSPRAIVIWSPLGNNTVELSYELAKEISKQVQVLLAELPCLGIPRLGFRAETLERDKNIDSEIVDLDKKGDISLNNVYKASDSFGILPANAFSLPDYPVTHKVKLETLMSFPVQLINKAHLTGYALVVLDCQGQLTTPMTYNSIKTAAKILIPIQDTAEAAYALINIKRLVQVFKNDSTKFALLTKHNPASLTELATIRDEDGRAICKIAVWVKNSQEIIEHLIKDNVFFGKSLPRDKKNISRILYGMLAKYQDMRKTEIKKNIESDCKEERVIRIRL